MNPKQKLEKQRAKLMKEIDGLRGADGQFASDDAREAFDQKMAEVETLDVKLRALTGDPEPTDKVDRDAILTEERARVKGIRDAVRVSKLEATFGDTLVEEGKTVDEARAAIFAELERKQPKIEPHIQPGEDATDKFLRGATNWLLIKGGADDVVARATKVERATIDPGEFRGMSLVDLARECLKRGGRAFSGYDRMRLIGEALTFRGSITQSTSDFAVLLENTMHKILQAAYATTPDTWRRFCTTMTNVDFRASNIYRFGTFGSLDSLSENGEFKNKAIQDAEKATITLGTKGNIINVSRQMIINDDMGAFARLLSMLGRAAALSVEVDVFALLAQNSGDGPTMGDGHHLFDNTYHFNKPTGTAITAAALDLDRVAMASQKDPNGNEYLDLRPAILLVPISLGGQARIINLSQYDPDNVASGSKATMKPNVVSGLFRDIVDTPRVSGTRRYLFADPGIAPVITVAFLEGQDAPVLESQDGWRTDGAEMKVRFDYAAAATDYRGAVTNAGV